MEIVIVSKHPAMVTLSRRNFKNVFQEIHSMSQQINWIKISKKEFFFQFQFQSKTKRHALSIVILVQNIVVVKNVHQRTSDTRSNN